MLSQVKGPKEGSIVIILINGMLMIYYYDNRLIQISVFIGEVSFAIDGD